MPEAKLVIVGHTTRTTSLVTVVGDKDHREARIVVRDATGALAAFSAALSASPSVPSATLKLEGLPDGGAVEYVAETGPQGGLAPTAEQAFLARRKRSFRTLPADRPLRIGILSCNGGHKVGEGTRFAMWRRLLGEVNAGHVDLLVHMGDQVYADRIWELDDIDPEGQGISPEDMATVAAITEHYRALYLKTWSAEPVAAVLERCPSIMMWDDHDIVDGWGSNGNEDSPSSQAFFLAARTAFEQMQVARNPLRLDAAGSYACAFDHGEVGVLLLDGRTMRAYKDAQIVGPAQWAAVDRWLAAMKARPVPLRQLFVVCGVPPVHVDVVALLGFAEVTPWREEITDDLRDSWVAPGNREECARLMLRLFRFATDSPQTMVTILSGDVHVGSMAKIESSFPRHALTNGAGRRIYQVVSSGIGYKAPSGVAAGLLRFITRRPVDLVGSDIQGELMPISGLPGHLVCQRNFAVLSMNERGTKNWDPDGNLYVHFFAENVAEELEQRLLRV